MIHLNVRNWLLFFFIAVCHVNSSLSQAIEDTECPVLALDNADVGECTGERSPEVRVSGTECNVTCHEGFRMEGDRENAVVKCVVEYAAELFAFWEDSDGGLPQCERNSCPDIDLTTISVECDDGYHEGSDCMIVCRQGYDIPFDEVFFSTTACLSSATNSTWMPAVVQCEARTCIDAQRRGNCTDRNHFRSQCVMTCEADGISGTAECVVNERGEMMWNTDMKACNSLQCVPLWQHNGEGDCDSFQVGAVCKFQCTTGYTLPDGGIDMAVCQTASDSSLATWSATISDCVPGTYTLEPRCPPIEKDNTRAILCTRPDLEEQTVCTIQCSTGYSLRANDTGIRTCISKTGPGTGSTTISWDTEISACIPTSCQDNTAIMETMQASCMSEDRGIGTVCTYSCKPGFTYPDKFVYTLLCVARDDGVSLAAWNDTLIPCIGESRCASNPCPTNWTCQDSTEGYRCVCISTNDTSCESACASNPCMYGGTCRDIYPQGYQCVCLFAQSGEHCEVDHRRFSDETKCDGTSCELFDDQGYTFIDALLMAIGVTVALLTPLLFWVIRERMPLALKEAMHDKLHYVMEGVYNASKKLRAKIM